LRAKRSSNSPSAASPTPEHFRQIYDEIAGASSPLPFPELPLRQILRIIPGQTPAQKRLLEQFESAVNQKDWSAMQTVLVTTPSWAPAPGRHLDAAHAPQALRHSAPPSAAPSAPALARCTKSWPNNSRASLSIRSMV
jgi:diguanylate cyclase